MIPNYEEREFPKVEDINNFEYHKVYLKIYMSRVIMKSKKIIPKIKKILKNKFFKV